MKLQLLCITTIDYNPNLEAPFYTEAGCDNVHKALSYDLMELNEGNVTIQELGNVLACRYKATILDD